MCLRFRGVTVSTSDSESDNPSSNLGGTFFSYHESLFFLTIDDPDVQQELKQLNAQLRGKLIVPAPCPSYLCVALG